MLFFSTAPLVRKPFALGWLLVFGYWLLVPIHQSPFTNYYSKAMPTPISAFSRRFLRSTLTILPVLIRANCPFSFAKVSVRGKFSSTRLPVRTGAVTGSVMKTPVLLMLQLRPITNLLACGIQTLTGQATLLRLSFRCSIKACIVSISLKSLSIPRLHLGQAFDFFIGNVNLDRLEYLGKLIWFSKKSISR
jgi:hypothetical protein